MADNISAFITGKQEAKYANRAANQQIAAGDRAIAEQRSQFDALQEVLRPYVEQGYQANQGLNDYAQAGKEAIFGKDQYLRSSLDSQIKELQREMDSDSGGGQGGLGLSGIANKVNLSKKIQELTAQRDSIPDNGQAGGLQAYQQLGMQGLEGQRNMLGLAGNEAQQSEIDNILQDPRYKESLKQGENSILQNASATGGLRGGDVQGALAQFSPQLLNQMLSERFNQYGGIAAQGGNVGQFLAGSGQNAGQNIAQLGQASAAGTGAAGLDSAAQISNLIGQQGAAQAGATMAQFSPWARHEEAHQSSLSDLGQFFASLYGGSIQSGGANGSAGARR